MTEIIIGFDLSVTCADGTTRDGVVFKVIDDVPIYETPDGDHLKGSTKVITTQGGNFIVNAQLIAAAIFKYKKEED
jgi:hypothetical protein